MMKTVILLLFGCAILCAQRQVAVTIDGLPLGGAPPHNCEAAALSRLTTQLLHPLIEARVPVTGFVIGNNCRESFAEALKLWTAAGFELGNHTWSHHDLNKTPLDEFEAD